MIYVFVNGGKLSHYDQGSLGETAFVQEADPARRQDLPDDRRTQRPRRRRPQGGRGTARYLFKHRDLFVSAAAPWAAAISTSA
ncbi:MAG: hypothetical protein R2748_05035 [Bryobacterales bacterium]